MATKRMIESEILGEFISIREYAQRCRSTPKDALETVEKIEHILDRIKWLVNQHITSPTDWRDECDQVESK